MKKRSKSQQAIIPEVLAKEPDLESEGEEEPAHPIKEELDQEAIEVLPAEFSPVPEELSREETRKDKVSSRSIVPYDPLSAYLSEIRRYAPMSKEEEHEVAVRYYRDKNTEAAYRLISTNLWLVVKIARDYERAARSILDLIQEGNIGLMEAVKNFDPYRGVRFPSYAVWWIKAYIIRFIIANWRLVKIGTTQAQRKLFFNLQREKDRLEREGFRPQPKLLAERLNVKESEVVEMEARLGSADVSVDAPLQSDQESNLLSLLASDDASAEELLLQKEMRRLLHLGLTEFASTLKDKEKVILEGRILAEEKKTLEELATKLGISRERVRQIENRTRDRLKEFFLKKLTSEEQELGQGE